MRILIADDEVISRTLLQATLKRLGHEVVAVADGAAAIEALLAPDAPRLAILDWMMPGANGLEVCRAIREHAQAYVYSSCSRLATRRGPRDGSRGGRRRFSHQAIRRRASFARGCGPVPECSIFWAACSRRRKR